MKCLVTNRLRQRQVAFDCAEWIKKKVEIRSVLDANFVHRKMYHVDDGRREHAIVGSSNFTRRGLGSEPVKPLVFGLFH